MAEQAKPQEGSMDSTPLIHPPIHVGDRILLYSEKDNGFVGHKSHRGMDKLKFFPAHRVQDPTVPENFLDCVFTIHASAEKEEILRANILAGNDNNTDNVLQSSLAATESLNYGASVQLLHATTGKIVSIDVTRGGSQPYSMGLELVRPTRTRNLHDSWMTIEAVDNVRMEDGENVCHLDYCLFKSTRWERSLQTYVDTKSGCVDISAGSGYTRWKIVPFSSVLYEVSNAVRGGDVLRLCHLNMEGHIVGTCSNGGLEESKVSIKVSRQATKRQKLSCDSVNALWRVEPLVGTWGGNPICPSPAKYIIRHLSSGSFLGCEARKDRDANVELKLLSGVDDTCFWTFHPRRLEKSNIVTYKSICRVENVKTGLKIHGSRASCTGSGATKTECSLDTTHYDEDYISLQSVSSLEVYKLRVVKDAQDTLKRLFASLSTSLDSSQPMSHQDLDDLLSTILSLILHSTSTISNRAVNQVDSDPLADVPEDFVSCSSSPPARDMQKILRETHTMSVLTSGLNILFPELEKELSEAQEEQRAEHHESLGPQTFTSKPKSRDSLLASVFRISNHLIKLYLKGYPKNENEFFNNVQFIEKQLGLGIGAETTMMELFSDNRHLLDQVTLSHVRIIISLIAQNPEDGVFLRYLSTLCVCDGMAQGKNQSHIIQTLLIQSPQLVLRLYPVYEAEHSPYFLLPSSPREQVLPTDDDVVEMTAPWQAQHHPRVKAFEQTLRLLVSLCKGRNERAMEVIEPMFPYDHVMLCAGSNRLPGAVRAAYTDLLLHLYIDRPPLDEGVIVQYVRMCPSLMTSEDKPKDPFEAAAPKIPNGLHFVWQDIRQFARNYLITSLKEQNEHDEGSLRLTYSMVSLVHRMIALGTFSGSREGMADLFRNLLDTMKAFADSPFESGVSCGRTVRGGLSSSLQRRKSSYLQTFNQPVVDMFSMEDKALLLLQVQLEIVKTLHLLCDIALNVRMSSVLPFAMEKMRSDWASVAAEKSMSGKPEEMEMDDMKEVKIRLLEKMEAERTEDVGGANGAAVKKRTKELEAFLNNLFKESTYVDSNQLLTVALSMVRRYDFFSLMFANLGSSTTLEDIRCMEHDLGTQCVGLTFRCMRERGELATALCRIQVMSSPEERNRYEEIQKHLGSLLHFGSIRFTTDHVAQVTGHLEALNAMFDPNGEDADLQLLFRNLRVHKAVMSIVKRVKMTRTFGGTSFSSDLTGVFKKGFEFLRLFCEDNKSNQIVLFQFFDRFMSFLNYGDYNTVGVLSAIFHNNIAICDRINRKHCKRMVRLIVEQGKKARYLRVLEQLVEVHGKPIVHNQELVLKTLLEFSDSTLLLFSGSEDEAVRKKYYTNIEEIQEDSELTFHLRLICLLTKCALGKNHVTEVHCRTLLDLESLVYDHFLIEGAILPVKAAILRFIYEVYIDTSVDIYKIGRIAPIWAVIDSILADFDAFFSAHGVEGGTGPYVEVQDERISNNPEFDDFVFTFQDYIRLVIIPFFELFFKEHYQKGWEASAVMKRKLGILTKHLYNVGNPAWHVSEELQEACLNLVDRMEAEGLGKKHTEQNLLLKAAVIPDRFRSHGSVGGEEKGEKDEARRRALVKEPSASSLYYSFFKSVNSSLTVSEEFEALVAQFRTINNRNSSTLSKFVVWLRKSLQGGIDSRIHVAAIRLLSALLTVELVDDESPLGGVVKMDHVTPSSQNFLDSVGVSTMVVSAVASDDFTFVRESVLLGCRMLEGGNKRVQLNMVEHLSDSRDEAFFEAVYMAMTRAIYHIQNNFHGRSKLGSFRSKSTTSEGEGVIARTLTQASNTIKEAVHHRKTVFKARKRKILKLFGHAEEGVSDHDDDKREAFMERGRKPAVRVREPSAVSVLSRMSSASSFLLSEDGEELAGNDKAVDVGEEIQYMMDVLLFLQLLCEGHNNVTQHYLRNQTQSKGSHDIVSQTVNLLLAIQWGKDPTTNRTEWNLHDGHSHLAVQCLATITEYAQGCAENQMCLSQTKLVPAINDILRHVVTSDLLEPDTALEIEGYAIDCLLSLLEAREPSACSAVLRQVDLESIGIAMDNIHLYSQSSHDDYANEFGPKSLILLMTLEQVQRQSLKERDLLKPSERLQSCDGFQYLKRTYSHIIGHVELMIDKRLQEVYFPIPTLVLDHWRASSIRERKQDLLFKVNRESPTDKLEDFVERQELLMKEMEIRERIGRNHFLNILVNALDTKLYRGSLFLVAAIHIVSIWFLERDSETHDLLEMPNAAMAISSVCAALHVCFTFLNYVAFQFSRAPLIVSSRRRKLVRKGKLPPELKLNVLQRCAILIRNGWFVWHSVALVCSVLGFLIVKDRVIFYCIHLFDACGRLRLIRHVMKSFTGNNRYALMSTGLLMLVVVYFYAVIGFYFFSDQYSEADGHYCNSLKQCLGEHLNFGIRYDAGIAEVMVQADVNDTVNLIRRNIFDVSYFIIITVVLLSVIMGIIIDAFAEMRLRRAEVAEDMAKRCFICGIESPTFDRNSRSASGFEQHIDKEHNMWQYLFFRMYLSYKDHTLYTGPEQRVWEMLREHDFAFFPLGKAMSLETALEEGDERSKALEEKIEKLSQQVHALTRTVEESSSDKTLGMPLSSAPGAIAAEQAFIGLLGQVRSSTKSHKSSPNLSSLVS